MFKSFRDMVDKIVVQDLFSFILFYFLLKILPLGLKILIVLVNKEVGV